MHTHGLWSTFHQHSQTHLYNHIEGVLAATDGSLKSPDRLGGGIAYRTNDGDSHGFPLLGLYTSLAAEAGALLQLLLEAPLDTPLTVLVDSLAHFKMYSATPRRKLASTYETTTTTTFLSPFFNDSTYARHLRTS